MAHKSQKRPKANKNMSQDKTLPKARQETTNCMNQNKKRPKTNEDTNIDANCPFRSGIKQDTTQDKRQRQETRDKRQETRDKRQETRDKRQETRDKRQETSQCVSMFMSSLVLGHFFF